MPQSDPNKRLKMLAWVTHGAGLAVALALVNLAYALALAPLGRQIDENRWQTARYDELLVQQQQATADHQALAEQLASLRQEKATLQQRIPDAPREAEFLAQVTGLADTTGLRIKDYRPGQVTQHDRYGKVQITLSCQGDYESLCRFLDQLSTLPRLARVDRLEVSSDGNSPEQYNVSLTLAIYFSNQRSVARSDDEPA